MSNLANPSNLSKVTDTERRRLPEQFVREGLKKARASTLFGVQWDDLSREELIAAAAQGWGRYTDLLADRINPPRIGGPGL